jgi:diguanylate cyclase (GGDEF)-like protein/PAS domain S-box-containing protein
MGDQFTGNDYRNRIRELERLLAESESRAAKVDGICPKSVMPASACTKDCFERNLMEISPDPMLVLDPRGRIVDLNLAVEEATGFARNTLLGGNFASCFVDENQAEELVRRVMVEQRIRNFYLSMLHRDGSATEMICNASLYRNEKAEVEGICIAAHDVTEIKLYEAQMLFQAHFDALTALPNRLLFRDRLDTALAHARRSGRVMGVMFIDLDNFKDINDTLGHLFGDAVLKEVASRLQNALRESDTVARLGDDEFAILVEGIADMRDVDRVAAKLLNGVAAPLKINEHEVVVSCSIGITLYPMDNSDAHGLLRNADTAMCRAKEDGKNNYRHFTSEMDSSIRRRVDIGNRLRRAINAEGAEFALHYQPRVELASGEITGVEALLRWNAAGVGPISPAEFIPVAEKNGTIVQIGEWVLQNACQQAKRWQEELGMRVPVAVNLSARQFREIDIAQNILRVLDETGLPPDLLELELTESMLINDNNRVLHTLDVLKDIGVRLAVDDFGTGYSSLSYLKGFPLDYLKVDRSFVTDIPGDQNDKALVKAIIGIAHNLGLKVIAEGIETRDQLDFMLTQDCDEIQGFYFSKPLPVDGITELLKEGRRLDAVASFQTSLKGM